LYPVGMLFYSILHLFFGSYLKMISITQWLAIRQVLTRSHCLTLDTWWSHSKLGVWALYCFPTWDQWTVIVLCEICRNFVNNNQKFLQGNLFYSYHALPVAISSN
jgi:hypothetical protein